MRNKLLYLAKVILYTLVLFIVWHNGLDELYVHFLTERILAPLHGNKPIKFPVPVGLGTMIPFVALVLALNGIRWSKKILACVIGILILGISHCVVMDISRIAIESFMKNRGGDVFWSTFTGNIINTFMLVLPFFMFLMMFGKEIFGTKIDDKSLPELQDGQSAISCPLCEHKTKRSFLLRHVAEVHGMGKSGIKHKKIRKIIKDHAVEQAN